MGHYYGLFSGGFDSTLAILKVISSKKPVQVTPIFFDYGQKSRKEEAKAARRLVPALRKRIKHSKTSIEDCRMLRLENLESGLFSWSQSPILKGRPIREDTDVENRNMILISCVASIIMADLGKSYANRPVEIITGFTNGYYDTDLNFIRGLNKLFRAVRKPIKVVAPLIPRGQKGGVTPEQLIQMVDSLDAYSLLKELSWSCYYPQNGKLCRTCDPCKKRKAVFEISEKADFSF